MNQQSKAIARINKVLRDNEALNSVKDAITELQDTRIHSARTGNYFQELCEEYALFGMLEDAFNIDLGLHREAIRDELRSEYSYDIVEDKRVLANGELAA